MPEKKIYVIAHCLLNPEARVKGIKKPAPFQTADSFGNPKQIIQLPCPELIYLGPNRLPNTKTGLDSPEFRTFCRELFLPYAAMIEMFERDGFEIEITGVSKSPSCGVLKTTVSENNTNRPKEEKAEKVMDGKGIFFEEIEKELKNRKIVFQMTEKGSIKSEKR